MRNVVVMEKTAKLDSIVVHRYIDGLTAGGNDYIIGANRDGDWSVLLKNLNGKSRIKGYWAGQEIAQWKGEELKWEIQDKRLLSRSRECLIERDF